PRHAHRAVPAVGGLSLSFPWFHHLRPLQHYNSSVRFPLERWRIQSQLLAPPPPSRRALFLRLGKPVLPQHRAHLPRRRLRKGIAREQLKNIPRPASQGLLGSRHNTL